MSTITRGGSRWVRMLIGVALTMTLLVWALRGMSPASVWDGFRTADLGWLGLSVLSLLASGSVRARRWGTLLGAQCNPGSFDVRQSAVFIGCAGNCLLPAHAGELVRGAILQRRGGVSLGLALGSIFAERLLDVIVVLVLLLVPLFSGQVNQPDHGDLDALQLVSIAVALFVVCGGIFAAGSQSDRIASLVQKMCAGLGLGRFSPRIVDGVRALIAGLGALRSPRRAATALGETVLLWGLSGLMFWTGMLAFGITSPGFAGALFTQSVTALGMAIPSAPGYFGPFEAAIRFSLEMYRIPTDTIIAFSLTLHALIFVSLITVGGVLAMRMKLSWSEMATNSSPIPEQPTEHKAVA